MKPNFVVLLLILFIIGPSIDSGPLFFSIPDEKPDRFSACNSKQNPQSLFTGSSFTGDRKEFLLKLDAYSKNLGKDRFFQIQCVLNLQPNEKEKKALELKLEFFRKKEIELFQYYENYLLSLDDRNLMNADERALTDSFLQAKKDLYSLLHKRTMECLFDRGRDFFTESDFSSIYLSLLRIHFEYLSNLNPELRNQILNISK